MVQAWPPKDPNEILDYGYDWSPRMVAGDEITGTPTAVVVTSATDMTPLTPGAPNIVVDSSNKATLTGRPTNQGQITWLSGGTHDTDYFILLRAVTVGGRHMDQTMKIKVKTR